MDGSEVDAWICLVSHLLDRLGTREVDVPNDTWMQDQLTLYAIPDVMTDTTRISVREMAGAPMLNPKDGA
jgi:hypothetical protein